MLAFFRGRALDGVEVVDDVSYSRSVRIVDDDGDAHDGWVSVTDPPDDGELVVAMSDSLAPVADEVMRRISYVFDVDRDPSRIAEELASLSEVVPGIDVSSVMLPGSFEPFEIACRAVLGQQVSVQAANRFAARIVETLGDEVGTDIEGAGRLWPTPERILGLDDVESVLGDLGVIRNRSRVIAELARLVSDGELDLSPDATDAAERMERLLDVKGIGPWTANYIAMRTLGHHDAFLEKDVGVIHALPDMTPKERLEAVEGCRPYRSYAVLALWNHIGSASDT